MITDINLGLLEHIKLGTLYLHGDTIYMPRPGQLKDVKRIGLLSAWLKTQSPQLVQSDVVIKAKDYATRINEFVFTVGWLIPYLKFLDTGDESAMSTPTELEQALGRVVRLAAGLRNRPVQRQVQPISTDLLHQIFKVPSALTLGMVIPLEPAVGAPPWKPHDIIIEGNLYRPCLNRARPLSEVIEEIEKVIREKQDTEGTTGDVDREAAKALLDDVENIIRRFEPVNVGRYRVVYKDRFHQVQYNRGSFVLVRGPVNMRNGPGQLYIGLHILGIIQRKWLATSPRGCRRLQDFWMPNGLPATGGMCVGNKNQYRRLLSSGLTDSEAIVQWIDAGVILATGISALHRQLRDRKLGHLERRRPPLRR